MLVLGMLFCVTNIPIRLCLLMPCRVLLIIQEPQKKNSAQDGGQNQLPKRLLGRHFMHPQADNTDARHEADPTAPALNCTGESASDRLSEPVTATSVLASPGPTGSSASGLRASPSASRPRLPQTGHGPTAPPAGTRGSSMPGASTTSPAGAAHQPHDDHAPASSTTPATDATATTLVLGAPTHPPVATNVAGEEILSPESSTAADPVAPAAQRPATCLQKGITKPKLYTDGTVIRCNAATVSSDEPPTVAATLANKNWVAAMDSEYNG
jgi:hypothetical protein